MAKPRRKYKTYKPRKKKLSPYTIAGIVALCVILCGTVTYKTYLLKRQSKTYQQRIEQLKNEQAEQNAREEELKEFKKHVKTDEYVEEIARDKLGLVHEGELVFQPKNN